VRILISGLRKLRRRLATFVTFGLLAGLLVLILVATGATPEGAGGGQGAAAARRALLTFPAAYDSVIAFIVGLGGLLAVVYAAAVAGSEWTWGTLKNAVARGESRTRYVVGTFASVAFVIIVGLLATFAIGIGAAYVGATIAGIPTDGVNDADTLARLPERLARMAFAVTEEGALGFAIATLFRSQLAGIGVGIAAYFGEQFAGIFLEDITKWLPFDAATAVLGDPGAIGGGGGGIEVAALDPNTAVVVVAAWLIGAIVVSAIFTERAEITG
jgi:ABC-type transport system involved in multi-copper enzyme maturation permease subunit